MNTVLRLAVLIFILFALTLAAEQIVLLRQITTYLERHPEPYRGIAIGVAVVGWVVLIGALVYLLWTNSRHMSDAHTQDFMHSNAGMQVFKGQAMGREVRMAASFMEIKNAMRSGAWWRDPAWRPLLAGLCAMPLICLGMFGFFIVVGPSLVKLLCATALAYAAVRTAWAFWRA